jgi:Cupin-like domain
MRSAVTRRVVRQAALRHQPCYYHATAQPIQEYTVVDAGDALTDAVRPFFEQQEPLVLRNLLQASPLNQMAMTGKKFGDWEFWTTVVDETTDCHVELGGNYASPHSQPADIPFAQFVAYMREFEDRFGRSPTTTTSTTTSSSSDSEPEDSDLIYLAQNDLFPEIYNHVEIPSLTQTLGQQQHHYSTMLWIGPYGCVSPLHYDPLDNLLMQFVGTKQFLLCPPGSPVPATGTQHNTSSWDPYTKDIPGIALQSTLLRPGDAIYMPKKWYHHVKTIQTSVSINTWFR